MMVVQERFIDVDTFWELIQTPHYEDRLVELTHGAIVEMPKPDGEHGTVTMEIGRQVANYVKEKQLGYVTAAETGFILERHPDGRDVVRGLDVAFIRHDRAPDLAVEVISPGNTASDILGKVLQLLHAGTRLVWLFYPEHQTVMVYTVAGAQILGLDDTLDGGEVLPGFRLAIKEGFHV